LPTPFLPLGRGTGGAVRFRRARLRAGHRRAGAVVTMSPAPATLPTPSAVAELGAQARRVGTPCGDGEIVWYIWGAGGPDPTRVVLLHGGSGSWTHWVRNIGALVAAGRTVWVPDLPGFGDSALPPAGGDADALVAPLAEGLQRL